MQNNVGSLDRIMRLAVGAILVILGIKPELAGMNPASALHWALLIIGIVMLITGIFRFCPAYTIMGMNTCKLDKK